MTSFFIDVRPNQTDAEAQKRELERIGRINVKVKGPYNRAQVDDNAPPPTPGWLKHIAPDVDFYLVISES